MHQLRYYSLIHENLRRGVMNSAPDDLCVQTLKTTPFSFYTTFLPMFWMVKGDKDMPRGKLLAFLK